MRTERLLAALAAGVALAASLPLGCYNWDPVPRPGQSGDELGHGQNGGAGGDDSPSLGGATGETTTGSGTTSGNGGSSGIGTGGSSGGESQGITVGSSSSGGNNANECLGLDCVDCVDCAIDLDCAADADACAADIECILLTECVATCDSQVCLEECAALLQGGLDAFLQAAECVLCDVCAGACADVEALVCN